MSIAFQKPRRLNRAVKPLLAGRPAQYSARLALDYETKLDAYRLRYESYLSSGHIEANETGLFEDQYDAMPNCQTIVIYDEDRPAASVRTCKLAYGSGQRTPAGDAYPDIVAKILEGQVIPGFGQRGLETTRLVRSPTYENNQGLVFLLYRMAGHIAIMAHTQVMFACVRTNHVSFYKRLGYDAVSEPRAYPGLNCPMQLLSSTRARYDQVRSAFPIIDPCAASGGSLDDFLSGETVTLSLGLR